MNLSNRKLQIVIVLLLTIPVVTTVFLVYRNQPNRDSTVYPTVYPVENAIFVYKVDILSKVMGKGVGNITYEITDVAENEYTVKRSVSENLDMFFENEIKTLRNDASFMGSQAMENGKIVENKIIEKKINSDKIELVLLHYRYQVMVENGKEKIDLWKLRKINVPIFLKQNFPDGNITAKLVKTNYEYLRF